MPANTRLTMADAPSFRSRTRTAAVLALAFGLAACQQFQTPSDILFAPTWDNDRSSIPITYGTAYDCRNFQGSGWKGIAGGRASNFDETFPVSRAGCFKTQEECQAFLGLMSSYITTQLYMRCQPYSA